jgi:hypothetical protein
LAAQFAMDATLIAAPRIHLRSAPRLPNHSHRLRS